MRLRGSMRNEGFLEAEAMRNEDFHEVEGFHEE